MKIGTGEGCYARASIFYDFGAFGELAISTFLVCTFGSPEHDGWFLSLKSTLRGTVLKLCSDKAKLILL
jgi:hypothetical protein